MRKTVEDRKAKMKLPVRFARILFLRSPGASAQVRARVLHFNEELIEGRIGLYDEAGRPCVLVDGFRAISMTAVRRAGASGGGRDLVYHVDWERTAPTVAPAAQQPLPLAQLRDVASDALEEVIALRGRAELEAVMAAEDDLAAAQIARGLAGNGRQRPQFSADSLGVAAPMRTVFGRLMDKLAKRGLLTASGGNYTPTAAFRRSGGFGSGQTPRVSSPGIPDICRKACSAPPLAPNSARSSAAKRMPCKSSSAAPNAELLDHFYGDGLFSSHWMASIGSAVQEAARHLPEGRGLRILEVGAGTAGLAAQLLPLLDRGIHTLHLHRRFRRLLLRRRTRNWRPSPRWNTRCSISKNHRPIRISSRAVMISSSAPTSPRRGRCPRDAENAPRTARSRRHLDVHGRGHAAAVDGVGFRPDAEVGGISPTAICGRSNR